MNTIKELSLQSIKFPNGDAVTKTFKTENLSLENLTRVNLFVGKNNTGKSRFLRSLFSSTDWYGKFSQDLISEIELVRDNFSENLNSFCYQRWGVKDNEIWKVIVSNINANIEQIKQNRIKIKNPAESFEGLVTTSSHYTTDLPLRQLIGQRGSWSTADIERVKDMTSGFKSNLNEILKKFISDFKKYPQRKVYLPISRTLRDLPSTAKLEYFSKIEHVGKNESGFSIFDGRTFFGDVKISLLHSAEERLKIIQFEKLISELFFNNLPVHLSPREGEKRIHIKIGNDSDFDIVHLGDGIQSVILMTFDAFLTNEPSIYFIEEPETFMHPGYQRLFVETIIQRPEFNRHQWFFTTHSNHFLDMTLDFNNISIFRFLGSSGNIQIQQCSQGDHQILVDLEAKASSVFRTNKLIWVEGITDRKYLKTILTVFAKKKELSLPKEDIDYGFIEFGGSCITHFNFSPVETNEINVYRICSDNLVVLDGDNKGKATRLSDLQNAIGRDNVLLLECKEIENSFSPEVLRAAFARLINSKKLRPEVKTAIIEKLNGLRTIRLEDPLGDQIHAIVNSNQSFITVKTDSGTIYEKTKICDIICEVLNETEDLSVINIGIAERLVSFIG